MRPPHAKCNIHPQCVSDSQALCFAVLAVQYGVLFPLPRFDDITLLASESQIKGCL